MFALTHVNRDNMRTLSRSNQGRNHFDTKEQADKWLAGFLENNSQDSIIQVFGKQALGTFEIHPVECYMHGDAVGVWFD